MDKDSVSDHLVRSVNRDKAKSPSPTCWQRRRASSDTSKAEGTKKWYHDVADFANLLKSFIGTNYLSLAYGILQSGLVLGIIGLFVIAAMTSHCCRLIVKVKYHAVRKLLQKNKSLEGSIPSFDNDEDEAKFQRLQKTITYADIGGIAYGKIGTLFVNLFLVITQVGFCIAYHIFIGSNIYSLLVGNQPKVNSSTNATQDLFLSSHGNSFGMLDFQSQENGSTFLPSIPTSTAAPAVSGPWIPPLWLLVFLPLPIFVVFTLIRRVRLMGPISFVANGMMAAGYFVVIGYLIANFSVAPGIELFKWATFPVFLGQASASYEAIGTLLSIEASMEGNHKRYPTCLLSVVGLFSAMLAASSIIGYLMFGEKTEQILVQNLPQEGALTLGVNVALIIAILFTYPLQVFPIIEILEGAFFLKDSDGVLGDEINERSPLVSKQSYTADDDTESMDIETSMRIPASVPTWKRNVVRVSIALFIGILAVLLKDVFAYVSAFVGALGSCPLAFILPCLFHLKICGSDLAKGVIVKDIIFIIVGSIMSVISLVVVVMQVVAKLS